MSRHRFGGLRYGLNQKPPGEVPLPRARRVASSHIKPHKITPPSTQLLRRLGTNRKGLELFYAENPEYDQLDFEENQ